MNRALPRTHAVWWPSLRALPLSALGVAVAAVVPVAVARLRDVSDYRVVLILAAVFTGGIAGHAIDDAAARTTASLPVTLGARRGVRLALLVGLAMLVWGLDLVVAASGSGAVPAATALVPFCAASAAIAVAAAARVGDDAPTPPGLVGAGVAVLVVFLVAVLAVRFSWLPSLSDSDRAQWWGVAAAAAGLALWQSRDPATRRQR